jgi:hypothetical protein
VALATGAAQFLFLAGVAIWLPPPFGWVDKGILLVITGVVGFGLWRFARVRAVASASGLRVHNLLQVTSLDWTQIVAVRLGGGHPWVSLDLSDGDTLPVMAIQRADGDFGQREAKRLATLVALNSRTERDS